LIEKKIKIIDRFNNEKDKSLVYYAKTISNNIYLILTINESKIYLNLIKQIMENVTNVEQRIIDITNTFTNNYINFKLVIKYINNNYDLIKPDGLCGLRVIYMYKKYIESGKTVMKDVNLKNEIEYAEFFSWLHNKNLIAITFQNSFLEFVNNLGENGDPDFINKKKYYQNMKC